MACLVSEWESNPKTHLHVELNAATVLLNEILFINVCYYILHNKPKYYFNYFKTTKNLGYQQHAEIKKAMWYASVNNSCTRLAVCH